MKKFFIKITSVLMTAMLFLQFSSLVFSGSEDPSVILADLDGDGKVTTADALNTLRIALGITEPTPNDFDTADVDRNGYIRLDDARTILRIAAGLEPRPEHIYSPWAVDIAATCQNNGMETCVCSHCGMTKTKITPKIHHTAGYCPLCGNIFTAFISGAKEVVFGDDRDAVKNIFGQPTETLAGNGFAVYIYETFSDALLNIFFFDGSGLCEVYTTDRSAIFTDAISTHSFTASGSFYEGVVSTTDTGSGLTYHWFTDTQSAVPENIYAMRVLKQYSNASMFNKSNDNGIAEKIIFYLSNQCRAMHNVPALQYSSDVAHVAMIHSEDMAENNYFSHKDAEGNGVRERLFGAGLTNTKSYGENIFAASVNPFNANHGWYISTLGHRENMLNAKFAYMGAGIAYNAESEYRYYGTQVFFTPF